MINQELSRFIVPGTDADVVERYATLSERARETVFGFEEEVVYVDIETTGFDPDRDAIVEIAAARARGPEILERFHTMVDPGRGVPPEITKLTGIDSTMLVGAPGPEAAAIRLAEFVGGRDVVAHNASFDREFLERAAGATRFPGAWIDSLALALIALPRLRSHRLADLACAFGGCEPTHRATDDVEALAMVYRVVLVALSDLPAGLLSTLGGLAPGARWAERAVIAHIAAGSSAGVFNIKEARRHRVAADRCEALHDAENVECVCPPVEEIIAEFDREGIAGRMYSGFEPRQEQARMAEAVLGAFSEGRHAAIEAGTGVGKSVAYLVPAARFALANGVGVGVATKTKSLMDQLIYSELPALCKALGEPLRYVSLKGYENYPCLRKVDRFVASLDEQRADTVATASALLGWIAQSSWGDMDGNNIHWRSDVRAAVTASVVDCTHKRCSYFPHLCYLHGVRRRAASAHIVVTNHALLFRDVLAEGGILPPIRHWIVDEAHAAESEARKQLTLDASHTELRVALEALHKSGRGGLLDALRRRVASSGCDEAGGTVSAIDRLETAVGASTNLADSLFDFVKDLAVLVPASGYDTCEVRITSQIRDSGAWATVEGVGSSLARKLGLLLEEGRALMTLLEEAGAEYADGRADLAGLLSRIAGQRAALVTVIEGSDDDFVYSLTLDRRRTVSFERLTASRLDVGEVLAEEFYPRTHAVVFTSATIATGDDFSHFARAIGLDRGEQGSWNALRLESSYDFERQMAVFVPRDIRPPTDRGYHADLERLLEDLHVAMGGSCLTLFTNRRDMESLYHVLEPRLASRGISLLVQGRGASAKRIRDEFLADTHLSLFATKSFWEGFDAKGDTLRCVIVPRLPFGRPNDPLAEERAQREGRAAWRKYALPEAIIELKQASGRLIRSATDTGCLVLADVRVVQKGYGREFLGSLPVRDIEVCDSADVISAIASRFGTPSLAEKP